MKIKLNDGEYNDITIVEWNDGDISLEWDNQMVILTPDEQKQLFEYLKHRLQKES